MPESLLKKLEKWADEQNKDKNGAVLEKDARIKNITDELVITSEQNKENDIIDFLEVNSEKGIETFLSNASKKELEEVAEVTVKYKVHNESLGFIQALSGKSATDEERELYRKDLLQAFVGIRESLINKLEDEEEQFIGVTRCVIRANVHKFKKSGNCFTQEQLVEDQITVFSAIVKNIYEGAINKVETITLKSFTLFCCNELMQNEYAKGYVDKVLADSPKLFALSNDEPIPLASSVGAPFNMSDKEILYYNEVVDIINNRNNVEKTGIEKIDSGFFYITNKRAGFNGGKKSFTCPISKIVNLQTSDDLVLIFKDGNVNPYIIKFDHGVFEYPLSILKKLINNEEIKTYDPTDEHIEDNNQ